ncbi:MAG: hypothetical protein PHZ19_05030 [Candidatus Thermoplasmatota archaeon]|nr:hypothetical protein [Candidatus Thermoplasmatota archaeon]
MKEYTREAWEVINSFPSPFFKYKHLQEATGMTGGTLRHALRQLKKEGLIVKYNTQTWLNLEMAKKRQLPHAKRAEEARA